MKIYNSIQDIPKINKPIVTIGTFDGVHQGHRQIINRLNKIKKETGGETFIFTFDPHPRDYFRPDEPAFHLMKRDQQARALEALGVEALYVLPLDAELAGMSDREPAGRGVR